MESPTAHFPALSPSERGSASFDEATIRRCAYEKWQRRGRPADSQLQDWLEAEAECRGVPAAPMGLANGIEILQGEIRERRRAEALLGASIRIRDTLLEA